MDHKMKVSPPHILKAFSAFSAVRAIIFILFCLFMLSISANAGFAEKLGDLKKTLKKDKINSTNANTKQPKVTAPKIPVENAGKVIQDIKNPKAPSFDAQTVQKQFEKGKAAEAKKLKASKDSKKILKSFKEINPRKSIKTKPARIGQGRSAPQRISEASRAPVSSSVISEMPPEDIYPPKTTDTTEIEGIDSFKEFYGIIKDDSFYQTDGSIGGALELAERVARMESIINEACSRYSNFPYLCSMFRYYYSEVFLAAIGTSIDRYGCEGRFDQVADIYSVDSLKNPVCKFIVDKAIVRKDDIRKNVETDSQNTIDKYKAGISNVSAALDALQKETIKYGDYVPTQEEIENAYMVVQYYYSVVAKSYLAMNKYAEAQAAMKDMDDFYNKIPKKYTMKYEDLQTNSDGSTTIVVKNKTYELKRDTNEYLSDIKDYIVACGKYCEVGEEGKTIFDDLQEHIAKIENYEKQDNDNIAAELLQYKKDHAADKDEKAGDKFYKTERKITKMYFTRNENIELTFESIPNPQDRLVLRCQTDGKGPQYRITTDVKSLSSNRQKSLKLIKNWINGGYYSAFQPNETKDPANAEKNLINASIEQLNPKPLPDYPPDDEDLPPLPVPPTLPALSAPIFQSISAPHVIAARTTYKEVNVRSISTAQCKVGGSEGFAVKVPPSLYTTQTYFNLLLARAYVEQLTEDPSKNVCPLSMEFLKSGGGEFIVAGTQGPSNEFIGSSEILIKHVANWFILQGHGEISSEIPTDDDDTIGTKTYGIGPRDLVYSVNTSQGTKFYSEYSGMDVLILSACYSMQKNRYKRWRRVLPQGVILGYHGEVRFDFQDEVMDMLLKELEINPAITQDQLGKTWAELNKQKFENLHWIHQRYGTWSYGYILPNPDNSFKNFYYSGNTRLCDDGITEYSAPNPRVEF